MFVKAYNETKEHGGINGYTPEMFLMKGKLNSCGSSSNGITIKWSNQVIFTPKNLVNL